MQKMFKKILCTLLIVVMCLTSAPLEGFVGMQWPELDLPEFGFSEWFSSKASAAPAASGSLGENVTYTYNSATGKVVISGMGAMTDYGNQDSPFYKNSYIRSVVIEDGVTSIGTYAFCECTSLTSITIPGSITKIKYGAFYRCKSLNAVYISDITSWCNMSFGLRNYNNPFVVSAEKLYLNGELVTNLEIPDEVTSIGDCVFTGCTSLTSVTIPDSVTWIGASAFSDTSLRSVTIGNSVTGIGASAFYNCTSLTRVTIPDSITWIGDSAFHNCTSLTGVYITDIAAWCNISFGSNPLYYAKNLYLNGELVTDLVIPNGVTSIGNDAFHNCTSLTSVTIPDSVTSIGYDAFCDCTNLIGVYLTDIAAWCNISFGSNPLYYAKNLYLNGELVTDLVIPNGVTSIGNDAFHNCASLTSVIIPDSATSIGDYAFSGCTNLTSITIPDSVTSIGYDAFCDCTNLIGVYITDIAAWCNISFGSNPLYYAKNLYLNGELVTDLVIPNGVTSIGNDAFHNCTSLTSVTIPDSVTSVGEDAFRGCTNLTSITIPDSVTSIGDYAFYECTSLESVVIGNGVTSIGYCMFYGCTNLTSITIPDSVTSIGGSAFSGCTNLTSITILDGVTNIGGSAFYNCTSLESVVIGKDVTSISDDVFRGCTNLTSITIPDSVTSIGNHAFYDCTSLESVVIGNGVISIGDFAFCGCTNLTSITIPDSVTSIGYYMFYDCTSLKSVVIGNGVTCIGYYMFYDCTNLTSITIPDSVTSIDKDAFYNTAYFNDETNWEDNVLYIGNHLIKANTSISGDYEIKEGTKCIAKYAFYDCESLASITIPDSVTSISDDVFSGCTNLTSITIPDSVTSIGDYAFSGCSNLTIICGKYSAAEAYAKNKGKNYTYGGYLSNGLKWEMNVTQLVISGDATYIPDFKPGQTPWINLNEDEVRMIEVDVENLTRVGKYAFYGMTETLQIDFKTENAVHFGKYACFGLREYTTVYYDGTSTNWGNCTFDYGNDTLKNAEKICRGDGITIERTNTKTTADDLTYLNFVEEHIEIAESLLTPEQLESISFYNESTIDYGTLTALELWGGIGDLGKLISFDFFDWSCSANYYDIYLSELILLLNNEQKTSTMECKITSLYNNIYKDVMAVLKTSEEWEEEASSTFEDEIKKLFKGENSEISAGAEAFLEKVLAKLGKTDKSALVGIFKGLDTASDVLDTISDTADFVKMFVNAYNAYIVSKAFCEVNNEFFTVLIEASKLVTDESNFRRSIDKARKSQLVNQEVIFDTMYSLFKDGRHFIYEKAIRETIQAVVYPVVATKLLGCASGKISAAVFAYNTTYKIMDAFTGLGKKEELYKTMYAIRSIERSLQWVVEHRRSKLINYETDIAAQKYDIAYNILRQTNIYLYDTAYKYGACVGNKGEMNLATRHKNNWNSYKCHYGNYGSSYNLFSAHCPVDVYIYDANGLLVTAVVNEEVIEYSEDIMISVYEGQKTFTYPTDKDYTVKIVAREDGTMDYSAGVITDTETEIEVKSYDIPLVENQEFTVELPTAEEEATEEDYKLETNETPIELDFSSKEACEKHSFGEWIDGGETKERVCGACGCIEYKTECDHSQYEEIIAYSVVPTCQNTGHSIYVCSGCGEQMRDGEDVDILECDYIAEEFEAICTSATYTKYTCAYCNDVYYAGITEGELAVANHSYDELTIEPTCTEIGCTIYMCSVCGDTYVADETSEKGHSYSTVVTEPTCTSGGYTTNTCSVCGDSYVSYEVAAKGHSYSTVVTEPTCTSGGYTTNTCSVCGDSYVSDEVTAKGHSYKTVVTQPTCTSGGYTTYNCSVCGDSYVSDEVSAKGHNYKSVVTNPTCTQNGYTIYSCENCSSSYRDNTVAPLGHSYVSKTIDNGCLEDKVVIFTCSCGDTYTEFIPSTGHDFDGSKCKNCDYDKSDQCSCNCHKTGFMGFIWKILILFYKLFGMNKVCDCGVAHY